MIEIYVNTLILPQSLHSFKFSKIDDKGVIYNVFGFHSHIAHKNLLKISKLYKKNCNTHYFGGDKKYVGLLLFVMTAIIHNGAKYEFLHNSNFFHQFLRLIWLFNATDM